MYWMDLHGADPDFYTALFGWKTDDTGLFTVDSRLVAGHGAPGRPGWNLHAAVDDVTATCQLAEELGGAVDTGPARSAIGDVATLVDPTGAAFVVGEPTPGREPVRGPMAFTWGELCTPEPRAARSFYSALFDWEPVDISMTMPSGAVGYTVFTHGVAEACGVLPAEAAFGPARPPYWLAYVEVDDTDTVAAHAEALGGAVLVEPFEVPRIGRIALLAGRGGEQFALMRMPAADR